MSRMMDLLAQGSTTRFQPDPNKTTTQIDSAIQQRLAVLVGGVALGLPIVLAFGAVYSGICFRDSISHFYYTQFLGTVFTGALVFIGGFLVAYTGEHWLEDWGSGIAGIGACMVALFPTIGSGCEGRSDFLARPFVTVDQAVPPIVPETQSTGLFQLFPDIEHFHVYGAATVFLYLGLYCLFVLRRVVPERHLRDGKMITTKRNRNILYGICGLTIIGCIVILGIAAYLQNKYPDGFKVFWNGWNLTFWFESIALWAFGTAWFAKGRKFVKLNDESAA